MNKNVPDSTERTVLAIDCGTQSLRAMIFSLDGKILAIHRIVFEPWKSFKPGWAEYNPDIYWNAVKSACQALRKESFPEFGKIAGIGITTIRDSTLLVDRNGTPLRSAIIWSDQRKAKPVYFPNIFMKTLLRIIGMTDTLKKAQRESKTNWIKQIQPELWEKTHKVLQVSGFLNYKLTGEFRDSIASQIGHIPFDYKRQKWGKVSDLMTFSAKIYPIEKEKLPEIFIPGKVLGHITDKACAETGLPLGLPVVACGSDKGCETIGMGVLSTHMASLSFGTTATIQITSRRYLEPIKFMPSFPAVIPGLFNPEVEIFRGFWMITWFMNEFAHKEVKKAESHNIPAEKVMDALLHLAPPGSLGLMVQPFWGPGLSEPAAKGAMIGYGDVHKKPHVYRAVIEGLIYALRDGKEKIERVSGEKIRRLAVSGGASQSNEICQIAADIFNLPIVRGRTAENSGLGAAIVTAYGLGFFNSINHAIEKMVTYKDEFHPNKDHVEIYDKLYRKVYVKIYKRLEPLYHKIREITGYPEK